LIAYKYPPEPFIPFLSDIAEGILNIYKAPTPAYSSVLDWNKDDWLSHGFKSTGPFTGAIFEMSDEIVTDKIIMTAVSRTPPHHRFCIRMNL
jgi:hypothetical protein